MSLPFWIATSVIDINIAWLLVVLRHRGVALTVIEALEIPLVGVPATDAIERR